MSDGKCVLDPTILVLLKEMHESERCLVVEWLEGGAKLAEHKDSMTML